MNLPTKLAITGVGVAVLMLLAFLTPAPAMAQIASCTTDASGNTVCDANSAREELLIAFSGTRALTTPASRRQTWRRRGCRAR